MPMTTASDIPARSKQVEQTLHARGRFGLPDVPSQAHSIPTVFLPHPHYEQTWFRGKVNVATGALTGERQFITEAPRVVRVWHVDTKREKLVSPTEALRLLAHGWHPLGVVNAPPAPPKPIGRL